MTTASPTNSLAALLQNTNHLRDIRPPVVIPNAWAWIGAIGGALVVFAVAYLLWRLFQKRSQEAAPPPIPPHVRAKRRLREALAFLDIPLEFCTRVSNTLRTYLEERFDFHAPERTTEEFLHELQGSNLLSATQKASLARFLERCDLVKFARYEPGEPELRDLHQAAMQLVEETEPAPEATTTPPTTDTPKANAQ